MSALASRSRVDCKLLTFVASSLSNGKRWENLQSESAHPAVDKYLMHGLVGTVTTLLLLVLAFPGDVDVVSSNSVLAVDLVSVPGLEIGRLGCRLLAVPVDVTLW